MSGATPKLNGTTLESNLGGFLPFEREITALVLTKNNLSITVDGHWLDVPPAGSPKGPVRVDYLMPGWIHRGASLRVVPEIFIRDVFAKPADVLQSGRRLDVKCTVDSGKHFPEQLRADAVLLDGMSGCAVAR
jgi:beta-galactosidase